MTLTAARTVNARFEVNGLPVVTITSPPDRSSFDQNGFDPATGLWFYTLTLTGQAVDPEDGTLTGSSLVWTTNRTDLQPGNLGQGTSITVRLYTGCSSATHQIRLTATDSNGGTSSAVIVVVIGNLC